ncbi:MAG: aminopeptidase [Bacteroidetes bacterium HGW-Bacteroidetes-8]|jgi:aminopeptidase N|nr:MAG: aminopeptidase [Bacteroidetes bacterium HGW-Bacteroidetes-8]
MRLSLLSTLILLTLFTISCNEEIVKIPADSGVSRELAIFRKESLSAIEYKLHFSIPAQKESQIDATAKITFNLKRKLPVILDFKPSYQIDDKLPLEVSINGKQREIKYENEHLYIPSQYLEKGNNFVEIDFLAGEQSLNRRDDMLYTLLVPDRARTLFPCFDQPDLKAIYKLSLEIPLGWEALANGRLMASDSLLDRMLLNFTPTEPISTYLFSFVAGRFQKIKESRGSREINIYHRESDPHKTAQFGTIFNQIFGSLEWLEEYTAIEYPFTKYDIAIVPGFQYGGMEHMGATLYSDRTMFLDKSATISDELNRAKLIAHETAHMWFGDYVTMPWFDDVWTKEVFANWFASKIVSPMFPNINHRLNFINTYFPASYAEDRSEGSNPVQQQLDNLNNAGLVYGNIIYNKAPIVMDKLVTKVGEESFRKGIREYLKSYSYSNASWDQLITILDSLSPEDLTRWSNVWIKERGMPHIFMEFHGDSVTYRQKDPLGRGLVWEQSLVSEEVPNSDGMGYGLFVLDSTLSTRVMNLLFSNGLKDDVTRLSSIINLYENLEAGYIDASQFVSAISSYLSSEKNPIIFSRVVGYLGSDILRKHFLQIETLLWNLLSSSPNAQFRSMAFSSYINVATSADASLKLYRIWESPELFTKVKVGERDLMKLSYELAVRYPHRYNQINDYQRARLSGDDRKKEFGFIYPSVSSTKSVRDSVFNSLLSEKNREVEPWAATALSYLNHRLIQTNSLEYIRPALDIIEQIQRSGDIFFPSNWLRALLGGHSSDSAKETVSAFLKERTDLHPMLRLKVLQQSHHLNR